MKMRHIKDEKGNIVQTQEESDNAAPAVQGTKHAKEETEEEQETGGQAEGETAASESES